MSSDPRDELAAVTDILSPLMRQLEIIAAVAVQAIREFTASPAGRQLMALATYYAEHPKELDELIRQREAEAGRTTCSCLCARWDHLGVCQMWATDARAVWSPRTGRVIVPACGPCAEGMDSHRVAALN